MVYVNFTSQKKDEANEIFGKDDEVRKMKTDHLVF